MNTDELCPAYRVRCDYVAKAHLVESMEKAIESLLAQLAEARASERAAMTEVNGIKDALAQTAEFICRKCGRRQDGPNDNESRF